MRVFALADPHLSSANPKPMDVFGSHWAGHPEVLFERWAQVVEPDDLVLVPGDISWAMRLSEALPDLQALAALPGQKVLLRGNHDYWWPSISKLRQRLPERMHALQNDALRFGSVTVAGTRGWVCPGSVDFSSEEEKVYLRELERLKLSLASARGLGGDKLVVMLHYPPTNSRLEPSGFTNLLLEAEPDVLVFGHLHNPREDAPRVIDKLGDTAVHFVAADFLEFTPKRIL